MPINSPIPIKDEEKNIAKYIESFLPIVKEGWAEVLVVDNYSTDRSKEIAESLGVRVIQHGTERSSQRNKGWKEAKGNYVFFVDADMRVPIITLWEIRNRTRANIIDALYVREVRGGTSWWIKARNFERTFYNATCIDGLRVIKRSILEKVGGYDENLFAAEDWDLDRRILAITSNVALTYTHLIHDEGEFSFRRHLKKKAYYTTNFSQYFAKREQDDITKKQFGLFYRFLVVFLEKGKWKEAISNPHYMFTIWFERFCVGLMYLTRGIKLKITYIQKGNNNEYR